MSEGSTASMSRAMSTPRPWSRTWAAYAACAWSLAFAAMSFYWAGGGTLGLNTLPQGITTLAREPWFVAVVWATGVLKVVGGLLALALVRPWGRSVHRLVLLAAAWGVGMLLALHGAANLAVRGLMAIGLMRTPESMHSVAARWYLLWWDPWWLVGGILFCLAAWYYQRGSRKEDA